MLGIAVGIARQCNCYSAAAAPGGTHARDSATDSPMLRRCFEPPATARKLL
jgi:hypothetical protein